MKYDKQFLINGDLPQWVVLGDMANQLPRSAELAFIHQRYVICDQARRPVANNSCQRELLDQADQLWEPVFLKVCRAVHMVFKKPNARGKPRRSAKHGGHPQAQLVGVGLTNLLGWWQMFGLASPMA